MVIQLCLKKAISVGSEQFLVQVYAPDESLNHPETKQE